MNALARGKYLNAMGLSVEAEMQANLKEGSWETTLISWRLFTC